MHRRAQQELISTSSLRDKVRLSRESQPHAGDWLLAAPNPNLASNFEKADFLLLISFRLGLPILPEAAAGAPCSKCGQALDRFGDHLVSCNASNHWARHNQGLAHPVQAIAAAAGADFAVEVTVQGRRPSAV